MTRLSWLECSAQLEPGDLVRFAEPWDIFPECIVPAGAYATVIENNLNKMQPLLVLRPESSIIRRALKHWDGEIILNPEFPPHSDQWNAASPLDYPTSGRIAARLSRIVQS